MYVSSDDLKTHDFRPRFNDGVNKEILEKAQRMRVKKNQYLRMVVEAFLSLPEEEQIKALTQHD